LGNYRKHPDDDDLTQAASDRRYERIMDREEAKAERRKERARATLGPLPGGGKAVLRVSIPVKLGGYTGQRDLWEEIERDYNVSLDGDSVVLHDTGTAGRKITFDRVGLEAALAVLRDYQS
jgi:hypothetical protein